MHPPGEDRFNEKVLIFIYRYYLGDFILLLQESADERWRPILGVEAIIISVISMLSDPNDESPANLDAAVSAFFLSVLTLYCR